MPPTSPVISSVSGPANVPGAASQFNNFFLELVHDGITALAGGGQTGATQIAGQTARVSTVATAGDSVMLPQAIAGLEILLINKGANPMQVFGFGTDTVDDVASGTGVSQMANSLVLYTCSLACKWYSEGLATGFGGPGLQTMSFTAAITAHAGGTQAAAVNLTSMINRVSTVATQGDSVALPAATVGLSITILNRGANPVQVFGNNAAADTINGIATATGISQGTNTSATYVCNVAGNWEVPLTSLVSTTPQAITASGAVPAHVAHDYVITKAGIAALTLAAPTATTDDGLIIQITSATANQHTLTATGLLVTGSASVNVYTFPASAGGSVTLMAFNAKWLVIASVAGAFS